MKRFVFVAGVIALISAAMAMAQDPAQPEVPAGKGKGQPDRVKGKGAGLPAELQPGGGFQPTPKDTTWGPASSRLASTRLASMEEEVETLEAHRDTKKAIVRAAEVAVKSAEVNLDVLSKVGVTAPQTEITKARLEVEAARAQLEIRTCEMKEVEVKIKYAKKRLEDAKAATVRPAPAPRPVDPPPPPQ